MSYRLSRNGISLVDLVIGVALLVVIVLGAFLSLKSIAQGRGGMSINARKDNKLRAIAEQIRYDAATDKYFVWDSSPTYDWTSTFDPAIRVTSYVEPESPSTRTRRVTLTASWIDVQGGARTSTTSLLINRVRAQVPGSTIVVRVVKTVNPSQGIPGVKVRAQGQNGMVPPFGALTDADGRVTIAGVIIGANIPVHVDGQDAKAFFMHDEFGAVLPLASRKWVRTNFRLALTSLNPENREFDDGGSQGPIQMVAPASLSGRVYDLSTDNNDPAPAGLQVRIFLKGDADMSGTPAEVDVTTTTGPSGTFRIDRIVPGNYFPAMLGNSLYAAQVRPGDDYFVPGTRELTRFDSDAAVVRNFRTGHKGSLTVALTKVNYVDPNYQLNGVAPSAMKFDFYRGNAVGYHDPSVSAPNPFSFITTTAWKAYLVAPNSSNLTQTDTVAGNATLTNFTPLMVHSDTFTYNMAGQYNLVRIQPYWADVPSPLTPIRVNAGSFPAGAANVKFLLIGNTGSILVPSSTRLADFADTKVKVNSNTVQPVYILERPALARVSGTIVIGTGGSEVAFSTIAGRVQFSFGGGAYGGVQFTSNDPERAYLGYYEKNTTCAGCAAEPTGVGPHTFDSYYALAMPNNLPPNIGAATTRIYFTAGLRTTANRNIVGDVEGLQKILDANRDTRYVAVTGNTIDATIRINCWEYVPGTATFLVGSRGNALWNKDVEIKNGRLGPGGGGFVQLVEKWDQWEGSQAVNLQASSHTAGVKIVVNQTKIGNFHPKFVLNFTGNSTNGKWMTNWDWGAPLGSVYWYNGVTMYHKDPAYAWNKDLAVIRRINTHVFGTVKKSSNGLPIVGATVRLHDRDNRAWTTTTNSVGAYNFTARYVSPYVGWNVEAAVITIPGQGDSVNYNPSIYLQRELFDSDAVADVMFDFLLTGSPVVDPGTIVGGGGGGGRGN